MCVSTYLLFHLPRLLSRVKTLGMQNGKCDQWTSPPKIVVDIVKLFGGEEKEKKEEKICVYIVVHIRLKRRYGGNFYSYIVNGGPGDQGAASMCSTSQDCRRRREKNEKEMWFMLLASGPRGIRPRKLWLYVLFGKATY